MENSVRTDAPVSMHGMHGIGLDAQWAGTNISVMSFPPSLPSLPLSHISSSPASFLSPFSIPFLFPFFALCHVTYFSVLTLTVKCSHNPNPNADPNPAMLDCYFRVSRISKVSKKLI